MTGKRVAIGLRPGATRQADEWVGAPKVQDAPTTPAVIKRLTIDISEDLHRRLKIKAAEEGVKMADLVRDWIETGCNASGG